MLAQRLRPAAIGQPKRPLRPRTRRGLITTRRGRHSRPWRWRPACVECPTATCHAGKVGHRSERDPGAGAPTGRRAAIDPAERAASALNSATTTGVHVAQDDGWSAEQTADLLGPWVSVRIHRLQHRRERLPSRIPLLTVRRAASFCLSFCLTTAAPDAGSPRTPVDSTPSSPQASTGDRRRLPTENRRR